MLNKIKQKNINSVILYHLYKLLLSLSIDFELVVEPGASVALKPDVGVGEANSSSCDAGYSVSVIQVASYYTLKETKGYFRIGLNII